MQGNLNFSWLAIVEVIIAIPARGKSILPNLIPSLGLTSQALNLLDYGCNQLYVWTYEVGLKMMHNVELSS